MPRHSSFIYKIIGVMFLCLLAASWLTFYAGAGYGKRQLLWQDVDGGWAGVSDWSVKGLEMEAGAIFRWNRLSFSAGVSTVRFRTCSATVGVGFCF